MPRAAHAPFASSPPAPGDLEHVRAASEAEAARASLGVRLSGGHADSHGRDLMDRRLRLTRVYETVLYANDIDAAERFYAGVLGLRRVGAPGERAAAYRLPDGGMLLLFDPGRSSVPGRDVPSHGARGPGHVAFAVPAGTLDAAAQELDRAGIALEREVTWPSGGRSLYVRDPAGNSLELVDGEIWP
jgi:catechol 2,3-dioxygenase-like lactoylglutathione lyase family enzyme